MLRKSILPLIALFAVVSSCKKDDIDPITGKNSKLKLENISFQNVGFGAQSITGTAYFEFFIKDTTATPDTIRFQETFFVSNPTGYNREYDFNTPENALQFNFRVSFKVNGDKAASASINNLNYKYNGTNYLNTQVSFPETNDSLFNSEVFTVTY